MGLTNRKKVVTLIILILLALFGAYIYYQSRNFLSGPIITITEPSNKFMVVDEEVLNIVGTAENISHLTLNGADISIDQNSSFNESLLLAEGFNIIEITGTDRFDHSQTEIINITYKPIDLPELPAAIPSEDAGQATTSTTTHIN